MNTKEGFTVTVWHKDGLVYDGSESGAIGRVYEDGVLASTRGKWKNLVVTIDSVEKVAPTQEEN